MAWRPTPDIRRLTGDGPKGPGGGKRSVLGRVAATVLGLGVLGLALNGWWLYGLRTLPTVPGPPPADGLYESVGTAHIHTRRSDGGGTIADVVRAAEPLDFAIVTDHNNITARDEGLARIYDHLTLLVEAEVSTPDNRGHFETFGDGHAPCLAPGGDCARAVPTDPGFAGNLNVVTHPFHPRKKLAWKLGYDAVQGIEVMNGDVLWRKAARSPWGVLSLVNAALWAGSRPSALQGLLPYPAEEFAFVDSGAVPGRVLFAGSDAHERLRLGRDWSLRFPRYATVIRAVTLHLVTEKPLGSDFAANRALILDALGRGAFFIANDLLADARGFRAVWETRAGRILGRTIPLGAKPVTWKIHVPALEAPVGIEVRIVHNGRALETHTDRNDLAVDVAEPGTYRLEVYQIRRMPGLPVPIPRLWIATQVYTVGSPSGDSHG